MVSKALMAESLLPNTGAECRPRAYRFVIGSPKLPRLRMASEQHILITKPKPFLGLPDGQYFVISWPVMFGETQN